MATLMYSAIASDAALATQSEVIRDFAQIWQAADKIVYSRRLKEASIARTWIEREFNPEAVRGIKTSARADMTVGGPDLAAQAFRSGLVDECHLFLAPIVVGSGEPSLPGHARSELELLDERRFRGGMVHLHYRIKTVRFERYDGPS